MNDDVLIPDVTISGRYPILTRHKSGLFSLDYALSSRGFLGLPLRVIIELYGYPNVGKSTLAYFLAGRTAESIISVADLEMADTESYIKHATAMAGFKGEVRMMDLTNEKDEPLPHEKILIQLAKDLLKEEVRAVIWDSVGATIPMAEMDLLKDPKAIFGEARMGKKAKLVTEVAETLRTALIVKKTPSTAIAVNHVHQPMGGRGHITTGGERIKFLSGVRMMLWTRETFRADDDDPQSDALGFLVEGQVEKLRFGAKNKNFYFYIVPGFGVHTGASAMFDAFAFGEAKRDARVKMDGKNMGFLKKDLLSYAAEGRQRKFYPFIERMQELAEQVEKGEELEDAGDDHEEDTTDEE